MWRLDHIVASTSIPRIADFFSSLLAATFLFASSFALSLAIGAWVEFSWRFAMDLDALRTVGLKELKSILTPNYIEALFSVLPGMLIGSAASAFSARLLAQDAVPQERLRRFILVVLTIQAAATAVVLSASLALVPALVVNALGKALSAAFNDGSREASFRDLVVDFWFGTGIWLALLGIALQFTLLVGSGLSAASTTKLPEAPTTERIRHFLKLGTLTVVHSFLFFIYVAAVSFPHVLLAGLSPPEQRGVVVRSLSSTVSSIDNAVFDVLLQNHRAEHILVDRTAGFEIFPNNTNADVDMPGWSAFVIDWDAGQASALIVAPGGSRWVRVGLTIPAGACEKRPDGFAFDLVLSLKDDAAHHAKAADISVLCPQLDHAP